jgi:hypothetical protein
MSRHRETLSVHYGADDFRDRAQLDRTLGRERAKDTTLDYGEAFARRRGVAPGDVAAQSDIAEPIVRAPSRFAGFRPKPGPVREAGRGPAAPTPDIRVRPEMASGVRGYAVAAADIERMTRDGLPALPHQALALRRAEAALAKVSPEAVADLRQALARERGLAARIGQPEGLAAITKAMGEEGRVRRDPALRAERFVETWARLRTRHAELAGPRNLLERRKIEARMTGLVGGLARDPQVETLLAGRRKDLGLTRGGVPGAGLGQQLMKVFTLGRGIDR